MPTLNEGVHAGEFLLSEGSGAISREAVTVASGEGVLAAGTVMGKVTASGKYVAHDPEAEDGSQTAAGVLYAPVDATAADAKGVVIARLAEVAASALTGDTAGLAALNIIVR